MNGAALREAVVDARRTELARLGSETLLVALTGDEPTTESLLQAAANSEHAAHRTFAAWADDEPNATAREAFADVAARERGHRERVLDAMETAAEPVDGGALHAHLRGRGGALTRAAAGMVGRGLVADRTHARLVSFFVDEADSERADLFRGLREETEDGTEAGLELLETLCATEADWEDARGVAAYTVQVAYDDYADALGRMDADPNPVR